MNVFIYSTHLFYSPHIETELELIQNHLNAGDKVYKLVCNGHLKTCDMNQHHEYATCIRCTDIRKAGEKLLEGQVEKLPIIHINFNLDSTAIKHCESVEELKRIYYKNFDIGFAIASSLTSILRESNFDLNQNRKIIELYYESAVQVYENCLTDLKKYKPGLVYIFNGRMAHVRALMRACQSAGVKFATHERGCDMNHYALFYNDWPHSTEYWIKAAEEIWEKPLHSENEKNKIAEEFFEGRRLGQSRDWTSFVKDQNPDLLPIGFDRNKENVGIFNSSLDEAAAISSDFKFTFFENQEELIENLLKHFSVNTKYHFYLRVHPNLKGVDSDQTRRISNLNFDNLTIIPAESEISTYFLAEQCNKVLSFGSTVGIESVYWNVPSISVGPTFYGTKDSIYKANSYEELFSLVGQKLELKSKSDAYKYAYHFMVFGIPYRIFKVVSLFTGFYKGKNLMVEGTIFGRLILSLFNLRFFGKPIAIYAKLYKEKKLKLHRYL